MEILPWSAPEVLNQDGAKPDPFLSDMWSFGVVVWGVTTRETPWEGSSVMHLNEVGNKGRRLDIPESAPLQIIAMYNRCCVLDPALRSTFADITEALQAAGDEAQALGS